MKADRPLPLAVRDSLIDDLSAGRITANDVPAIRVFERNGQTFALDNRRLLGFQEGGVPIRTVPATAREALSILSTVVRDRPIVPIPSRNLVLGLGAVHCLTQQESSQGRTPILGPDFPGLNAFTQFQSFANSLGADLAAPFLGAGSGCAANNTCGVVQPLLGPARIAKALPRLNIDPKTILSGGRGGGKVKNLVGPPNSVVRGGGQRAFVTNERGQVVLDITKGRVKPVTPGQGFGSKRAPTQQELSILQKVLGNE